MIEAIERRRNIRTHEDRPVPRRMLEAILRAEALALGHAAESPPPGPERTWKPL